MTSPIPDYLRLLSEPELNSPAGALPQLDRLAELCCGFEQLSGWPLLWTADEAEAANESWLWSAPVDMGAGSTPGFLGISESEFDPHEARPRADLEAAKQFAQSLVAMLNELGASREAVWKREAELAAGVPVVSRESDQTHLAEQLEAVLKSGAEMIGCQAAGLYLLDPSTTELKLRSCWGLPSGRLLAPPRPLKGSVADLEALTGHAVVLEDDTLMEYWRVPEMFPAAVCVPVASGDSILGTLWIFSDVPRDFSEIETGQIEIIAGRLAADLQREMLLTQQVESKQLRVQFDKAERMQASQLPNIAPLLDNWQVAGWTLRGEGLGGNFYDWQLLQDDQLTFAIGDAQEIGPAAAMVAGSLRSAMRAHAQYQTEASAVLREVNQTLWATSAGEQFASATFGKIDTLSGALQLATAGQMGAVMLSSAGWHPVGNRQMPLAVQPESNYSQEQTLIPPGATLVVFTDGLRQAIDAEGCPLDDAHLAEALLKVYQQPVERMIDTVRELLETKYTPGQEDCSVVVLRHRV